ncbi:MAG: YeeE/YedE family protein [Epsilonproteobacteria bacterium]|nr:MAG: YeeE/YedE family protein [Campylobacterota bacterium]RLA65308.1 MAG: YeeE/YedE family protein [Campylobacterota bacterium]
MDLMSSMPPLAGGILIGLAASIMLFFNGRITGVSGLIGMSLTKITRANDWRYLFIAGLILGSVLLNFVNPTFYDYQLPFGFGKAIVAGLLVGFGTRLGRGCTSGHGVCGLPRLSKRSLVVTLTFMGVAIITRFIMKQF